MNKRYPIISVIFLFCFSVVFFSNKGVEAVTFHTQEERVLFSKIGVVGDSMLIDSRNELFASSGQCSGCHGFDSNGIASLTSDGEDINVVDDWRATMMAMSAKDPFWRAKVSHEVLVAPGLQNDIESSCTDCHAPMGFFNAMHLGLPHYTMQDLEMDSVALDGVSCGACHQISPDGVGSTFSGQDIVYEQDVAYGQYQDPFGGPMTSFVGFEPLYSEHVEKSEMCASCHTLITETVGLDGEFNGQHFVEQATYHEWVNSAYNADDESAVECQGCHMTRVDDDIVIAANLLFLDPRTPFFRHDIVGGNTFMLSLMKEHRDTLNITAYASHFDTINARTRRMLQHRTLDVELTELMRDDETLTAEVILTNKAGHKFPSGYPSRIAFVKLIATTEEGDTLLASGLMDNDYELVNRDFPYEPHYDVITSDEEVQVYEIVLANEAGEETTVLSQADHTLKDNRLVPFGFTTSHFAYDTTLMYGQVLLDDDFNLDLSGQEGSGVDVLNVEVPLDGYGGVVTLSAEVYYQVVPPRWLDEMFDFNSAEINHFADMYAGSDKEPVLVGSSTLQSWIDDITEFESARIRIFPNPTITGAIAIDQMNRESIDGCRVFDANGNLVLDRGAVRGNTIYLDLPSVSGVYFIEVTTKGQKLVKKVLRL